LRNLLCCAVQTALLQGKTIMVTGATDGVGLEAARAFSDHGARVIVHGRNEDKARRWASYGDDAVLQITAPMHVETAVRWPSCMFDIVLWQSVNVWPAGSACLQAKLELAAHSLRNVYMLLHGVLCALFLGEQQAQLHSQGFVAAPLHF
jgi:enoyl-[acyl-carrier-protein] reductase (NADH)